MQQVAAFNPTVTQAPKGFGIKVVGNLVKISRIAIPIIAGLYAPDAALFFSTSLAFGGFLYSFKAMKQIFDCNDAPTIRKSVVFATNLLGTGLTCWGLSITADSSLDFLKFINAVNIPMAFGSAGLALGGLSICALGLEYVKAAEKQCYNPEPDALDQWIQNPIRPIVNKSGCDNNLLLFDYFIRQSGINDYYDVLHRLIFKGLNTIESVIECIENVYTYGEDNRVFHPLILQLHNVYTNLDEIQKESVCVKIAEFLLKIELFDSPLLNETLYFLSNPKHLLVLYEYELFLKDLERKIIADEPIEPSMLSKANEIRNKISSLCHQWQLLLELHEAKGLDPLHHIVVTSCKQRCQQLYKHPVFDQLQIIQNRIAANHIDKTIDTWDYLCSNGIATFEELKAWTGSTDLPSLGRKLIDLKIPDLQALMDKNLVTQEEFDHLNAGKISIKAKVLAFIERYNAAVLINSGVKPSLVNFDRIKMQIKKINRTVIPIILYVSAAVSLVVPIILNPYMGISGLAIGVFWPAIKHQIPFQIPWRLRIFNLMDAEVRQDWLEQLQGYSWGLRFLFLGAFWGLSMAAVHPFGSLLHGINIGITYQIRDLTRDV